ALEGDRPAGRARPAREGFRERRAVLGPSGGSAPEPRCDDRALARRPLRSRGDRMKPQLVTGRERGVLRPAFDVQKVRADFPILSEMVNGKPLVYLDNAATSHKPRIVIDAVSRFYERDNSNVHRGLHQLSERSTRAYEGARIKVQRFLNARDS